MTIIKYPKTCTECGGSTQKRTIDIFVCENPGCRHIDADQLLAVLKHYGIHTELIKKVEENLLVNEENLITNSGL